MVWSGVYGPPVRLPLLGILVLLIAGLLVPPAADAAAYAQIEGSGATASELLVEQWIADAAGDGLKVVYNGVGAARGRSDFAHTSTDFGISELPFQGGDDASDRPYAYVPLLATGLAFPYHLERDGRLVEGLRFSAGTLARIFAGDVTSWSDPAIAADNNGRRLPGTPIRTVVRADGSATTHVLTGYLAEQASDIWAACGSDATQYFPQACGGKAVSGSDQVVNTVRAAAGDGTIGYVESNYAAPADVPVAAVQNAAGRYVHPDWWAVSLAVRGDTTDRRSYPLSYVTSAIVPTAADDPRMTTAKRQALVDFLSYAVCAGQLKAAPFGYAPLPLERVRQAFDGIEAAAAGDPGVDLSGHDPGHCDNPTFDETDLDRDVLGEVAAMPAACQRSGAGPCGTSGPPADERRPAITGRARVGAWVQADPGRWVGADGFRYRWLADGRPIAGARRPAYRIAARLLGSRLTVRVTATSEEFPSRTVSSAGRRVRASG